MQKDKAQERAVEFLDWIDSHYDDWVMVSWAIGLLDIGETDTIHILKKAYENGLAEIYFTYLMNVEEAKAITEAREKYMIGLLKKEIKRNGFERMAMDFERQLQERRRK